MSISPLPNVIVTLEQTVSTEDDALGPACCGPENDPKPELCETVDWQATIIVGPSQMASVQIRRKMNELTASTEAKSDWNCGLARQCRINYVKITRKIYTALVRKRLCEKQEIRDK